MGQMIPDEPVIFVKVRDLIEDLDQKMNRRLDEIGRKLDDRITVGVFSALRSDLDNALKRLGVVEDELLGIQSRSGGVWWTLGRIGAVLYGVAMTVIAIWGLTHGG